MKIEKVNDRQIRCTLTKNDLTSRNLKISELAYGTEKAKKLFKDMMREAFSKFGFEAEDIPLMIEAIPLSGESIILIITKVDDPEELDTRFSKFAPSLRDNVPESPFRKKNAPTGGADDILDLFKKLREQMQDPENDFQTNEAGDSISAASTVNNDSKEGQPKEVKITIQVDLTKLYSFDDLDNVIRVSKIIKGMYNGDNALYKSPLDNKYYLLVRKCEHTPEVFNKICNMITEYGHMEECTTAIEGRIKEHFEPLLPSYALQKLSII